jgi:hypothetical protein
VGNSVRMVPGWQKKLEAAVHPYQRGAASDIGADIRSNLRAGGHVDTGALMRSVDVRGEQIRVGTDHWRIIEEGSRPHIISTRKRSLRSAAGRFFGKRVRHPGTKAYHPIKRAVIKKRRLHKG